MVQTKLIEIEKIKLNPDNPRVIRDDKFKKLVKSIKDFPEMLNIRPIVVNSDLVVLGGNMRLKACKEAGLTLIPILIADNLTDEQQKEFIIKDNNSFGDWDWTLLGSEWDTEKLEEWAIDIPNDFILPDEDELVDDERNKPPTMRITFNSVEQLQEAEIDIQELIDRKYHGTYFSVSVGEI